MLLAAGTLAQAASYNTATESTGWQGLGFTDTLYLPQFDTSLGTLTGVTLHITDSEQAEVTIENGSASPASITVNLAGSVEATDNDTIDSIALLDQSFGPYSLAANEGPIIPTYNGSGPDFQDLGLISDTATKTAFSSDISLYEGPARYRLTSLGQVAGTRLAAPPIALTLMNSWAKAPCTRRTHTLPLPSLRAPCSLVSVVWPWPA